MYRLLLVDDFFVERENVKEIVAASGLDLSVVGEAANGREALALLEREPVDFILTDIEMPLMNGLQLAEQVRSRYPGIHIVFFTLYDKFEYARRALQLGAHSFILKPVDRMEMIAALQQVIALRQQEEAQAAQEARLLERLHRSMPLLLAQFRRDLFTGVFATAAEIEERLSFFDIELRPGSSLVLAAQASREGGDESEGLAQRELAALRLSAAFEDALAGQPAIWTRVDADHWAFALHDLPEAAEPALTIAFSVAEALLSAAQTVHIRTSIGVSRLGAGLHEAAELYHEALQALSYEFGRDAGQIVTYEDIQGRSPATAAVELQGLLKAVSDALHSGEPISITRLVDRLLAPSPRGLTQSEAQNVCFEVALCAQMVLRDLNAASAAAHGRERMSWDALLKLGSLRDAQRWLVEFLSAAQQAIRERGHGQAAASVAEARRFIENNYSKPISVQSVALHVRYSANYLNNLFKQETGETLLECLTRVRVGQAKRLLSQSPRIRISEIVEAVGYTHEAHFRTVFKQYTGLTPKEYREKALRGGEAC